MFHFKFSDISVFSVGYYKDICHMVGYYKVTCHMTFVGSCDVTTTFTFSSFDMFTSTVTYLSCACATVLSLDRRNLISTAEWQL